MPPFDVSGLTPLDDEGGASGLDLAGLKPVEDGAGARLPDRGDMPGELHLNPSIAPRVPKGAPRPLAPGEFIKNPNGSWSSEVSATVENPDLNGGKPTVIPSMWIVDGKPRRLSEDQAAEAAVQSGLKFRAFSSIDEADKFASDREDVWQGFTKPEDASKVPALWEPQAKLDLSGLTELENPANPFVHSNRAVADEAQSWRDTLKALPTAVRATLAQTVAGMRASELADLERGAPALSPELRGLTPEQVAAKRRGATETELDTARAAQADVDAAGQVPKTMEQRAVVNAAQSLAQGIPAMAVGMVTRNPELAAATMYPTTAGQSFGQFANYYQDQDKLALDLNAAPQTRDERLSDLDRAQKHAMVQGGLEVATEVLPFEQLFKPGSSAANRLISTLLAELPGESVATVTQQLDQTLAESPPGATVDEVVQGLKEGVSQLPDTWAAVILQTAAQSGAVGLAEHGASRLAGRGAERTPERPPEQPAPEQTGPEVRMSAADATNYADQRRAALEGRTDLTPAEQNEAEFLRGNPDPETIANAYGVKLAVELTPEDQASPIPDDLILQGKTLVDDALNGPEGSLAPAENAPANLRTESGAAAPVQPALDTSGLTPVELPSAQSAAVGSTPLSQEIGSTAAGEAAPAPDLSAQGTPVEPAPQQELKAKIAKKRERSPRSQFVADPRYDTALEYISKKGGINSAEAIAQGIDPAAINNNTAGHGIRRVFQKQGMSFDAAAELLHEAGYPVTNAEGRYDANKVLDVIDNGLRGQHVYSSRNTNVGVAELQQAAEKYADAPEGEDLPDAFYEGLPKYEESENPAHAAEHAQMLHAESWDRHLVELSVKALASGSTQEQVDSALDTPSSERAAEQLRQLVEGSNRDREAEAESNQPGQPQGRQGPPEAPRGEGLPAQATSRPGQSQPAGTPAAQPGSGVTGHPAGGSTNAAAPRTPSVEPDLLGHDTRQAQALADQARAKDEARSPNKDVSLETGNPGDLFSQARNQIDLVDQAGPTRVSGATVRGEKIGNGYTKFSKTSGTLGIPREDMPQIKAEHRGALANFLKARGIEGAEETVPASSLKPTQAEFSEQKVLKAKNFQGGDRAILVSSDGYVLDGHHQWMAALDKHEDVRAIRLDAPIKDLLKTVPEFPSAEGGTPEVPAQAAEQTHGLPEGWTLANHGESMGLVAPNGTEIYRFYTKDLNLRRNRFKREIDAYKKRRKIENATPEEQEKTARLWAAQNYNELEQRKDALWMTPAQIEAKKEAVYQRARAGVSGDVKEMSRTAEILAEASAARDPEKIAAFESRTGRSAENGRPLDGPAERELAATFKEGDKVSFTDSELGKLTGTVTGTRDYQGIGADVLVDTARGGYALAPRQVTREGAPAGFKVGDTVTKRGGDIGTVREVFTVDGKQRARVHFHTDKTGAPIEHEFGDEFRSHKGTYEQNVDLKDLKPAAASTAPLGLTDEVAQRLHQIRHQLIVFSSGMSRPNDIQAGGYGWAGLDTRGIGVDVGELSANGIKALAKEIVDHHAQVFVDSGAFSLFRRNLKSGKNGALNFDAILERYSELHDAIGEANPAEEQITPPMLVMPDIVGDQAGSLALAEKYKQWIGVEAQNGRAVVPIQTGALSLADAYRQLVKTLGTDKFIVGVPSNEKAVSAAQFREFVKEVKPTRVHFLGSTSEKNLAPRLMALAEAGYDMEHVSADANVLRASLYGRNEGEGTRQQNIVKTLTEKGGPELAAQLEPEPRTPAEGAITPSVKVEKGDLASQLANVSAAHLDALIDQAVEETGAAETEKPAKQRAPRTPGKKRIRKASTKAERAEVAKPAELDRTTKEIAKSLGYNLSSAGENALKGLAELFGGPGKLNSGLTFDEDTYAKAKPYFQAMLRDASAAGKDIKDFVRSIVESFGSGIRPYLHRFVADLGNEHVSATAVPLERDRGAATSPAPGDETAHGAGPERAAAGAGSDSEGTGIRGGLAPSDARVLDGGAPTAGEQGDQSLRAEQGQRLLEGIPAGSDDGGRSSSARDARVPPDRTGASEPAHALAVGDRYREKLKAQADANRLPVIPGDAANIDRTLPFLLEGQRSDVKKTEDRYSKPDGYGMLFTNGTGTGKTFTGLGVIRRYVSQGKTNILITAPSDKVVNDWITSGKALGLTITQLDSVKDAGKGIVVTTYANFGQNDALAKRDWDLIVHDEAHYLAQNKDGTNTDALNTLRALTLHPDGAHQRAVMLNRELADRPKLLGDAKAPKEAIDAAWAAWRAHTEQVKADVAARQLEKRPRALFLSATPFAYEKTIDWANGYLFDYDEGKPKDEGQYRGYNQGSNKDQFFMQHFGYRMKNGRLTEPDAKVDRGLMQRQFNTWMKKRGVLSGRVLDVDHDYDRRFVLIDSKIGNRIDALMEWAHDTEGLDDAKRRAKHVISDFLRERFDHLSRRYLLEAIKAEASVDYVKKALALGRKVVVFHDFKKGGGFNPFKFNIDEAKASAAEHGQESKAADLAPILDEYNEKFADLINSDIGSMRSPINTYRAEFPNVLLFNGDVPPKQRRVNVAEFNDDASGPRVILAQSAAGKEGISLHDTTGKHPRMLLNLGLPTQPTTAIQQEGRIYRVGQESHAAFRYFNTGTSWEKWAFATTIAQRASAAENLAQGEQARALKDSFIAAFQEADAYPPGMEGEGTGGKERDRAANEALTDFDRAVAFYYGTEKKNARTKAREGTDYYATPEPVGLKMAEWAGIRAGDKALEPSAGHGALARWFPTTAENTAIEPSDELASRLAMVFDGTIKQQRFEDLHVVNKYDAIVMNPPFGHGGSTAIEHLDKAVGHLRDGGRVVALIPTGPAADAKFEKWYEGVKGAYLAADIRLPQVTFERAATKVAARIVVLDKVSDEALADHVHTINPVSRDLTDANDVNELFARIKDMSIPDRPPPAVQPEPEQPARPTSTAPTGTFEAAQTKHGRTGEDLYVAKINRRLSPEEYSAAKARAKSYGGWYSNFRGAGAIPGFQFKKAEARDAFIGAAAPAAPTGGESFSIGELGYYSALSRAADGLKQEKGTPEQMLAMLRKTPGVKEDEIAWTGLDDYLKGLGPSVTKQQIADFLEHNGVQVEETTLGNDGAKDAERRAADLQVQLDARGYDLETDHEGQLWAVINRRQSAPNRYEYDETRQQFLNDEGEALPDDVDALSQEYGRAIEDVNYSGPNREGAKFEQYTLPGGDNYREVLLTLPPSERSKPAPLTELPPEVHVFQQAPDRWAAQSSQRTSVPIAYGKTHDEAAASALALLNNARLSDWAHGHDKAAFRSSHFSEPNILAHVRLKDRTAADGSKVLFVEEVQSDWAQQGRRKGFAGKNGLPEGYTIREVRIPDHAISLNGTYIVTNPQGEQTRVSALSESEAIGKFGGGQIPKGPFVQNTDAWAGLALKRVIRMAAEGGYDAVAWTTGEQQADRYDLSKHINKIIAGRTTNLGGRPGFLIQAYDKNDRPVFAGANRMRVDAADLADHVGKEMADRIERDTPEQGLGEHVFKDLDLKIGGEGMKSFYDSIIPKIAGGIAKKLGGRVEPVQLVARGPGPISNARVRAGVETAADQAAREVGTQPGIRITPDMRAKAQEGLPLFQMAAQNRVPAIPYGVSARPKIGAVETKRRAQRFDKMLAELKDRLSQVGISDKVALKLHGVITDSSGTKVPAARGRYANRIIELALGNPEKLATLDHEIIHALRDLGVFRDTEWRALAKEARGDTELMASIERRYKSRNLSEDKLTEEAVADMHARYAQGKLNPKGFVKTALERIRNFFAALRNALQGNGFQSAADVFEAINRGELGSRARPALRSVAQPAFSLGDDEQPKFSGLKFNPAAVAPRTPPTPPPSQAAQNAAGGDTLASRFFDEAVFRFQDKFNYLAKAQKAAAAARGVSELGEHEDPYLAELRYHGMAGAAIEDFQREHVEPLVKAISETGLGIDAVDRYLLARHAPEANAQLAKINPEREDNQALSGMSNEEAAAVIDGYRRDGKLEALDKVADRVDAITKAQRDLLVSSGLERAETVAKWQALYKHYVPLHREGFDTVSPGRGQGFSVAGRQKRRAGSNREVSHVVAQLVAQHETTIVRTEKNKVDLALLNFAKENPNPELYAVDKVEFKPSFDSDGLVTYRPTRGFAYANNVVVAKVEGQDHTITFNPRNHDAQRIAYAMKNLGAEQAGTFVNLLTKVNRFLALVNTGANPEFIISNFARDLQTAGYNISSTEADGLKWKIIGDVGKAWRGIRSFQKRNGRNQVWADHFDRFRKAGGQTGWMEHYSGVAAREKKLVSMVKDLSGKPGLIDIKRGLRAIEQFVEHENTAVENAIRLSAFVHATAAGISEAKAARIAKELTVNFNRKGDYGQLMNALYLFYNAGVQGSAAVIKAAAKSPKVRAMMGATIVGAMLLDILNRAIGGTDPDDDKDRYDKIPDYVKERNLVIMLPDGKGDYIKIPLPWGYNVLHVIGQVMGEAVTKTGFKPGTGASRVFAAAFSAFNPLGSEASILQMLSPTITDPLVQWAENKDWTGRKLHPDQNSFDVPKPQSQLYFNSVREPSKWVTNELNSLTGGNEIRPGWLDISPAFVDLITDTFTGGAGKFLADVVSTPLKALKGDEVESSEIPVARRVYGKPGTSDITREYYERADAVRLAESEFKHFAAIGDRQQALKLRQEHADELRLAPARAKIEEALEQLRQQRRHVDQSRLSDDEKKARDEKINGRIKLLMQRFNRIYNERVKP